MHDDAVVLEIGYIEHLPLYVRTQLDSETEEKLRAEREKQYKIF